MCMYVCVCFYIVLQKSTYHFVYHICARPSTTLSLFTPLHCKLTLSFVLVQYGFLCNAHNIECNFPPSNNQGKAFNWKKETGV